VIYLGDVDPDLCLDCGRHPSRCHCDQPHERDSHDVIAEALIGQRPDPEAVTKPAASDMTHSESRHDDTTHHDHAARGKTAGQGHDPIFRDLDAPDPPMNIFLSPQDQTDGV
jgi:hypothetical protein